MYQVYRILTYTLILTITNPLKINPTNKHMSKYMEFGFSVLGTKRDQFVNKYNFKPRKVYECRGILTIHSIIVLVLH